MTEADHPSSVSIDYDPNLSRAGTTVDRFNDLKVVEENAHLRRVGSRGKRTHHVVKGKDPHHVTSIRMTDDGDYQNLLIQNQAEKVSHQVGINHTHVKVSVIEHAKGIVLKEAKYTWMGDRVEMEGHFSQIPLGIYEETPEDNEGTDTNLHESLPPKLDVPSELQKDKAFLLFETGQTIRNGKNYLPPSHIVELSSIISDHAQLESSLQLPLEI